MKDHNEYDEYELDRGTDYFVIGVNTLRMLESKGIKSSTAALLYGKILSLSTRRGGCVAGNAYFSNVLNINDRTIRMYLSQMMDAGLFKRYDEKDDPYHTRQRHLYPLKTGNAKADAEIIELHGNVFRDFASTEQSVPENNFRTSEKEFRGEEENFQNNATPEKMCMKPGRKMSSDRKKDVSNPEERCHQTGSKLPPITYYNNNSSIKYNRTEEVADAPQVAYAPDVATLQAATPEYILNLKFNGNIPDHDVLTSMRNFCHHRFTEGIDIDEFREDFMEAYTSKREFIKCDIEPVEIVLDWFLEYSGVNHSY